MLTTETGEVVEWIEAGGEYAFSFDVEHDSSPGGHPRIVFEQRMQQADIWRCMPGSNEEARPLCERNGALSSTRRDGMPHLSPDGTQVAFVTNRSGRPSLWINNLNGSEPWLLTGEVSPLYGAPEWSSDGRFIAIDARSSGNSDVYLVEVDGGGVHRLTTHRANDIAPTWSADGRSIYFGSDRSGTWQVWRKYLDEGVAERITRDGGHLARESPDGQSLVISRIDQFGLWIKVLPGGEEVRLPETLLPVDARAWGFFNEKMYMIARQRGETSHLCQGNCLKVVSFLPETTATWLYPLPGTAADWYAGVSLLPSNGLLFGRNHDVRSDLLMIESE